MLKKNLNFLCDYVSQYVNKLMCLYPISFFIFD